MEIPMDKLLQIIGEQKVKTILLSDQVMVLSRQIDGLKKEVNPPGKEQGMVEPTKI